jgi:hypothetical protein
VFASLGVDGYKQPDAKALTDASDTPVWPAAMMTPSLVQLENAPTSTQKKLTPNRMN